MDNYIKVPCIITDKGEKIIVGSERYIEHCDNLKMFDKNINYVIYQESYDLHNYTFLEPITITNGYREIPKYQKGQEVLYALEKWGEFKIGIIEDVVVKETSQVFQGEDLFFLSSIEEDIEIEDAGLYKLITNEVIYKIKGVDKEFKKRDLGVILNKQ